MINIDDFKKVKALVIGDMMISLLGLGLAVGATFNQSASIANAAAGIVVAKVGTATASIDELKQALAD